MSEQCKRVCLGTTAVFALLLSGCAAGDRTPTGSVATAWSGFYDEPCGPADGDHTRTAGLSPCGSAAQAGAPNPQTIATVNGQPIARRRVVGLLLRSRGVEILEQLIGLQVAAMAATRKGLTLTRTDIDREYDLVLRSVTGPLSSWAPGSPDHEAAERFLATALTDRHMSREELDTVTRRNAYLRKIVESQQTFTDGRLRREFQRVYGERVRVRHIQLATLTEVARVKERLRAGDDFGELAGLYSANPAGAENQGLLDPFSAKDEELPALFRKTAFALQPGEVSSAVRLGEWYHLIKLEEVLPAVDRSFADVHGELERSLRERLTQPAMAELLEKLLREANITIDDPILADGFEKNHRDKGRLIAD